MITEPGLDLGLTEDEAAVVERAACRTDQIIRRTAAIAADVERLQRRLAGIPAEGASWRQQRQRARAMRAVAAATHELAALEFERQGMETLLTRYARQATAVLLTHGTRRITSHQEQRP